MKVRNDAAAPTSRVGRTLLFAATLTIAMIASVLTSGSAQASYQPCTNYRVTT